MRAFDRGNYHGLKLTDQLMKLLERVLDFYIHDRVNIDEMQFGFVPGSCTIGAIFVVRQLQEKYIKANKLFYFVFVDLKKSFDHVPEEALWWALRSLIVEEWAVRLIQCMYSNAQSRAWFNGQHSEEFGVGAGVHKGFVLSPPLFILVLKCFCWSSALVCHGMFCMLMIGAHRRHPGGMQLQAQGVKGWHGK